MTGKRLENNHGTGDAFTTTNEKRVSKSPLLRLRV